MAACRPVTWTDENKSILLWLITNTIILILIFALSLHKSISIDDVKYFTIPAFSANAFVILMIIFEYIKPFVLSIVRTVRLRIYLVVDAKNQAKEINIFAKKLKAICMYHEALKASKERLEKKLNKT